MKIINEFLFENRMKITSKLASKERFDNELINNFFKGMDILS